MSQSKPPPLHLWYAGPSEQGWAQSRAHLLDDHERQSWRALGDGSPKAQIYVLGRVLRRQALGAVTGIDAKSWVFRSTPAGRPIAQAAGARPIDVSLAHTGATAVVAVWCGGRVGIDIEPTERLVPHLGRAARLIANVLTPQERVAVGALGPDEQARALVRLWALKEAAVKALGTGLRGPWRAVSPDVPLCSRGAGPILWAQSALDLRPLYGPHALTLLCALVRAPVPQHVVAVAIEGHRQAPVLWGGPRFSTHQ